jgi:Domain of unknown function (DUF1707)
VRLSGLLSSDSHLRAGDADRERVAEELTRHCADGRLSPDELSDRVEAAYGSRTLGELATLTRDLPRLPVSPPPRPQRRTRRRAGVIGGGLTLVLLAALGAGAIELLSEDPATAALAIVVLGATLLLLVAALGSLLAALAPIVALGLAARWVGRRLAGALDAGAPRRRLRA